MTTPYLLSNLLFAQQEFRGEDAIVGIVMMIFALVMLAVMLALLAYILYTYYTALNAIPPQFRTMEPGLVFLLLIPCFGIIWLFFIVTKIPESFRNYFQAVGEHRYGDCGASVGMWYAVLSVIGAIPYLGILASIPALVCMILFLVKVNEMKNAVNSAAGKPVQYAAGGVTPGYGDPNNPYASPGDKW